MEKSNKELELLNNEIVALTDTLDNVSNQIIFFENTMRKNKFHLPFQFMIKYKNTSEKDMNFYYYLAWETAEDNNKNYRLFLLKKNKEQVIFKKALIETKAQTRIECAPYLSSFINAFAKHIKQCRIDIETNNNPEV